jgi:short subunit dehydrogenase-like uncharacterized protein
MAAAGERPHDVVLFGATGFTGGLTAEYLAEHAPSDLKVGLAGRSMDKLERVRAGLQRDDGPEFELLVGDVGDEGSMREIAESTRVVATTVGPYINYGEPLVAACAKAGTDYTDLTGEPEFADRMYVNHQDAAVASGARIIHACGFDSIPHDLGARFTVSHLPDDVPLKVEGFVRAGGTFSGGTYHSAITAFSRVRQYAQVAKERKGKEKRPSDRRVRGVKGRPHHEGSIDSWVVPFPSIDPQIVLRSARALPEYGPDFSYGHYIAVKRAYQAAGLVGGTAGLFTLAQIPPARKWLLGRKAPGEGPTHEQRAKGWFKVRFRGEGGGQTVVTEVSGGDPGYGETAKMLAESAMCLAQDDLPETAGQVTTAQAMGEALTERLENRGIAFSVLDEE